MALILVGSSHRVAPIEIRERLAYGPSETPGALHTVRDDAGAREAVLLSTCNRTEVYLVEGDDAGGRGVNAEECIRNMLGARLDNPQDAHAYTYVRRDREAAAHLFRVASGMDSMILGEAQILGQVRHAWELCRPQAGPVLNRLFQTALLAGSRVRTETGVGRGAASVSSAAVQLAKKIFGSLHGRRAMILGAGEMAELALECLTKEGVRAAVVANRTFARASQMARRHGATAVPYDAWWDALPDTDVLLCSMAAPHPVVTPDGVAAALETRGDRPLCILDIALPRDVDARVGQLDNVFLYDLDDLRGVVASNLERRHSELLPAEDVIAVEVEKYWQWLAGLAAVPVLTTFRATMDRVRQEELSNAMRRLGHLPLAERQAIEHFSRALMNKFLHEPSVRLRAAAANGRGLGIVDATRYLFGLDADESSASTSYEGDVGHD